MAQCFICQQDHHVQTVEHIVPRALGNIHYILPKGSVCNTCNHRFSRYEHAVLNSHPWLAVRREYGLVRPSIKAPPQSLRDLDLRRFLLKMMYESLYLSRRRIFDQLNLEPVRTELTGGPVSGCRIIAGKRLIGAKPIPGWMDRWRLKRNHIGLYYLVTEDSLWFEFCFARMNFVVEFQYKMD